ncbi:DNA-binding transcriptional regulator, AcrR family [Paenimyroides ummariense]|uniref:DNA-binding transcriptional regulator, AcrR family n=1 Tax=Paenimyroides ummariense TaxID=913024 RepID=A0A1I4Y7D2_9FLAO|nr:TetR/AcrR family transcriptional regulator [Paenimyroides ummariense]SFN33469.1 DNA-binding transcriptional regulator, AcrR family [Paenimyroides ummariense]
MEDESKSRKRTSGKLRDKERTKVKMVQAVGKVLLKKGYTGLNASAIAKEAGIDKSLVWTYFGSLDNLVEEYIAQRDFWKYKAADSINNILTFKDGIKEEYMSGLFQFQFQSLLDDEILQRIMLWGISEKKDFLRHLSDERELIGEEIFKIIDPQFQNSDIDIRGILAILVAGIYYLVLHGKTNGSLFCGIDLNTVDGKIRIKESIAQIVSMAYKKTIA